MSTAVRRSATLCVVLALLVPCLMTVMSRTAHADQRLDQRAVDRWIGDYVRTEGLAGASVAVIKNGEPVYRTGEGQDADGIIAADRPMAIGSVSKMITAFAVLQLIDAGRIDLDQPVRRQLPEFTVDDPRGELITVRQLLSHRTGLPNPTFIPPATSPEERVAQLRDLHLDSDPGTAYVYSNLNYHVAARLVEVSSGQDFSTYLHDHVFTPLGMDSTRAVNVTAHQPGSTDGHVTVYGGVIPLPELVGMNAGAGGVISTADDLARWLAMQQRGGVAADGTRLLSADLVREAQTPVADSSYGFGWQRTQTSVPERVGHDGSLTRYSARVELVPSTGYGVVVLLNSYTPITKHPFEISAGIIDLTEGRTPDSGAPVATIVDALLGLITVLVAGLGVRGAVRSGDWVARRRRWSGWRFGLRLLPQLVLPAVAVGAFVVLPRLAGDGASAVDAFGLWPAAMILLLVSAVVGLLLTAVRVGRRLRPQPSNRPVAR